MVAPPCRPSSRSSISPPGSIASSSIPIRRWWLCSRSLLANACRGCSGGLCCGTTVGVLLAIAPGLEVGAPDAALGQGIAVGGLLATVERFPGGLLFSAQPPHPARYAGGIARGGLELCGLALGVGGAGGAAGFAPSRRAGFRVVVGIGVLQHGAGAWWRAISASNASAPPRAALVATAEPLVTLVLAALLLSEFLVPAQLLGRRPDFGERDLTGASERSAGSPSAGSPFAAARRARSGCGERSEMSAGRAMIPARAGSRGRILHP